MLQKSYDSTEECILLERNYDGWEDIGRGSLNDMRALRQKRIDKGVRVRSNYWIVSNLEE